MKKQIKLYSVSLGMVKTEKERELTSQKSIYKKCKELAKNRISEQAKNICGTSKWTKECSEKYKELKEHDNLYINYFEHHKKYSTELKEMLRSYKGVRKLNSSEFEESDVIAFHDNVLIRTLGLKDCDEPTLDFIVIEANKTDYILIEQVVTSGLYIDGELYKFFTAGAGQTRKKKFMMIKTSVWDKYEKTLMCGLTIDKINELGGINVAKFLAYLSLNNSSSQVIKGLDIDKCIVVDDFSNTLNREVDYISRKEEIEKIDDKEVSKVIWDIERTNKDITIEHMDGCGIMLPSVNKKNQQWRLPWIKGLMSPVDFLKYAKEEARNTKIVDIWGKEWDIEEDSIQVIFTKSQFKLWKYYKSWDEYKTYFKQYNCTANLCKEDEDILKDMVINYQMLQTLTDMTDEQIELLTKDFKRIINDVHHDRQSQLEILGATENNKNRGYFEEVIRIYPELLTSKVVKDEVKRKIDSIKRKAKSGKIKLNEKRVFIVPDLVAFMEWLFKGEENPKGVLNDGEVYFNPYNKDERLGILRSPHLSREWAIRKNIRAKNRIKWFNTNAIYVSNQDLISLILMLDWDGDEALVVSNKEEWLLDLAEEQMKDIRPLYYEMGKAGAIEITGENIYNSLKFAYENGNIGDVSNAITNIWDKDYKKNMDNIKKLCAYNNYVIDSAKTLEVPKIPKELESLMNCKKYPYFFQFAKNKKEKACRKIGNRVINRICRSVDDIEYTKFNYKKGFGNFKPNLLLNNSKIEINEDIINKFLELEEYSRKQLGVYKKKAEEDDSINDFDYKELVYMMSRKKLKEYADSIDVSFADATDMIVKWSFKTNSAKIKFMFNGLGDIIYENLNNNIKKPLDNGYIMCSECGTRVLKQSNSHKKCKSCVSQSKNK